MKNFFKVCITHVSLFFPPHAKNFLRLIDSFAALHSTFFRFSYLILNLLTFGILLK